MLDNARTGEEDYTGYTTGLYEQDMLSLTRTWKLVLGGRYDNFRADYDRPEPAGDLSRRDTVISYRSGVLYQPDDASSYYVSYGTSYNPSDELYALDDRSANTQPEKNRNIEAGAKWEALDGNLSLRTAIFRSERPTERDTDNSVSLEQKLLSGKRHTDGIELESAGRISSQWEVFGALALMKARIDEATGQQANTVGNVPLNTPKFTYYLWTTYALTRYWRLGGCVVGAGLRYGNNTNTIALPGYTRLDAMGVFRWSNYAL